jgi:hypothetical protein
MKKTALLFALAAIVGCNNASETKKEEVTTSTTTTDSAATAAKPAETPPPPMDSAAQAKAMMDYMTPGEMHKWLASLNGKWEGKAKYWTKGPDAPDSSMATEENKMVMGGRYQQSTFKTNMGGMPMEGLATTGYDNAKQKFVCTWIDNMGTGIMMMEGTYDPATKTLNMSGKMIDPTSKKEGDVRQILTFTDDKHRTMELFMTQPGQKEMKFMEVHYTKK